MLRRVIDWSEITAKVVVFGQTTGKDVAKSSIQGVALDTEIAAISNLNNQFTRVAVIQDQQIKNLDQANRKAQRELSMRHRRKDAWEATVDGWTYWNGSEQIPWAPDATADIHSDVHGGALGRHLIHRVRLSLSSGGAVTTQLALVAPGIWKL
jgi:prophage tail gpP-like protein